MKKELLLVLCSLATPLYAETTNTPSAEWPLHIEGGRAPVILYQPQPESLKDDKLTARAAVSVQPEGKDPVFGAVWIEARVDTDRKARTVTVKEIEVTRTRFAGATPEREQLLSTILTDALSKKHFIISLDRLLVSLETTQREMRSVEDLGTAPPQIFVATSDAMLVILDGEPQLRKGRVVNTPYDLTFSSASQRWQLKAGERSLSAPDLKGPWQDIASTTPVPIVFISTQPAELIMSKGEPDYTPLPENQLLYMKNTDSDVFVETATSKIFVLLSGRWYAATTLSGPWTFVRPDQLPAAFAKIPPESPKASVLASVAGSEAAKEAVLEAQVPQTAAVKRKEKDGTLKIIWDGDPKFKKIDAQAVEYSLNASAPVFGLKQGYWACDQGVWYTSTGAEGPWVVADSIPKEIYEIPPTCPYYNCRYVHVFHSTPEVVYVGYYPGYVGSYPYYGVVVYGTGYPYSGWYGSYYYGPTVTFGFGFAYYPYYGWGGGYPVYPIRPGGDWGRPGRPGSIAPRPTPHASGDRPQPKQNVYNRPEAQRTRDSNNVYADRDGNISRRTDKGQWQDRTSGGWKDNASPRQDVQRDYQARDRGAQRAAHYQNANYNRPSHGGAMRGGGGMRGGGRR